MIVPLAERKRGLVMKKSPLPGIPDRFRQEPARLASGIGLAVVAAPFHEVMFAVGHEGEKACLKA